MWSDCTPPAQLRSLVAQLHSVLPAPRAESGSAKTGLLGKASVEQLAELLQDEPGFAWVNQSLLQQPIATIEYSDGNAAVRGPGGAMELRGCGFDILRAMLEAWRGPAGALLAGFLSYDLASEIEDLAALAPEHFEFPKFYFGLFDSVLTFTNETWSLQGTDAWRGENGLPFTRGAAEDLLARARNVVPRIAGPRMVVPGRGTLNSHPDRASFGAAVERIVAAINAGDFFQTNLCRSIETALEPGTEFDLYRRMRSISPARYEAFLRIDDRRCILSISPELFLKLNAGVVESCPIKGTRPRAHDAEEDGALSAQLLASEKDRAELAMIVDVVRNDLGRVCETGSVKVVKHAELMSLPTVHHLFSTVSGRLRVDAGIVDLLRAAFPAASITGAPKIEAMRVAMREEGQRRGPSMGAIGWIGLDGSMELSVAIRTAFVTEGRVRYYAGCGITSDSNPADEFMESRHKAAAFVRALGMESDPNW